MCGLGAPPFVIIERWERALRLKEWPGMTSPPLCALDRGASCLGTLSVVAGHMYM